MVFDSTDNFLWNCGLGQIGLYIHNYALDLEILACNIHLQTLIAFSETLSTCCDGIFQGETSNI